MLDIDPIASLSLCSFAKRKDYLKPEDFQEVEQSLSEDADEKTLNMIDMIPTKI